MQPELRPKSKVFFLDGGRPREAGYRGVDGGQQGFLSGESSFNGNICRGRLSCAKATLRVRGLRPGHLRRSNHGWTTRGPELELTQPHMTQGPVLWDDLGRVRGAYVVRREGGFGQGWVAKGAWVGRRVL